MHGRINRATVYQYWRSDSFRVQRFSNLRQGNAWRSYWRYANRATRSKSGEHPLQSRLSIADLLVRGLFARRSERRKHAVRQLEKSCTRSVPAHFAKLALRVQRERQVCPCIAAGSFCGNQSPAPQSQADDTNTHSTSQLCNRPSNRPAPCRQRRHRIFQRMEWNLFSTFLSPTDWWNVRLTCSSLVPEEWTWANVWHGPSTLQPYRASRLLHAFTKYSLEDLVRSITNIKMLILAFQVVKWRYGKRRAIQLADCCRVDDFRIVRTLV